MTTHRQRLLDELRVQHGRLDAPIEVGDGGSLRVELNHSNMKVLPSGLQSKNAAILGASALVWQNA